MIHAIGRFAPVFEVAHPAFAYHALCLALADKLLHLPGLGWLAGACAGSIVLFFIGQSRLCFLDLPACAKQFFIAFGLARRGTLVEEADFVVDAFVGSGAWLDVPGCPGRDVSRAPVVQAEFSAVIFNIVQRHFHRRHRRSATSRRL
jgi:hypothetical protein